MIERFLPMIQIVGIAIVGAIVFGTGWTVRGWKADAAINAMRAEHAEKETDRAQKALTNIEQAIETINAAAKRYGTVQSTLSAEIADLKKELQNEAPLPVDCVPSAGRVRGLNAAIDAANKASSAGHAPR